MLVCKSENGNTFAEQVAKPDLRWRLFRLTPSFWFPQNATWLVTTTTTDTCGLMSWQIIPRCQGDYLFCFRFATSASSTFYYSNAVGLCWKLAQLICCKHLMETHSICFFFAFFGELSKTKNCLKMETRQHISYLFFFPFHFCLFLHLNNLWFTRSNRTSQMCCKLLSSCLFFYIYDKKRSRVWLFFFCFFLKQCCSSLTSISVF